jgi:hypothetical protein
MCAFPEVLPRRPLAILFLLHHVLPPIPPLLPYALLFFSLSLLPLSLLLLLLFLLLLLLLLLLLFLTPLCNQACLGVNLEEFDGTLDTTRCAVGYRGNYCSACDTNFWRDGYSCHSCADSVVTNLGPPLFGVVLFFVVVGLCCALLPLDHLTRFVGYILDAQLLSIILSVATPYIDKPHWLVDTLEVGRKRERERERKHKMRKRLCVCV